MFLNFVGLNGVYGVRIIIHQAQALFDCNSRRVFWRSIAPRPTSNSGYTHSTPPIIYQKAKNKSDVQTTLRFPESRVTTRASAVSSSPSTVGEAQVQRSRRMQRSEDPERKSSHRSTSLSLIIIVIFKHLASSFPSVGRPPHLNFLKSISRRLACSPPQEIQGSVVLVAEAFCSSPSSSER